MGGPRRAPGEALEAMEEAVELLRLLWSDQRSVRFEGGTTGWSGSSPDRPRPIGGGGFLDGPAAQWVEQLLPLVTETGMDTFVLWPSESSARQLQLFADEVAPALREAVAAHRGHG
jgi:hypothetical protein